MPIGPVIRILVKNIILSAFNVGKAIEPILAKVQQSCPPKADIEKFIKQKNNSAKGLNEIKKTLQSINDTANIITTLITALDIAITVAKLIPFPPFVPGNKLADILMKVQKIVENAKSTLKGIPEVIKIVTDIIIQIIEKIQQLEAALQNCLIKDVKKELAFNSKKAYKKGDIAVKSKDSSSKTNNIQNPSEVNTGRDLNPQSGGISKNSEINNFKTDNSNIGNDGSNNANIGDEIDPSTGKIINEKNTGTGTEGTGTEGTGTEGTGTEGTGTEGTGTGGTGTGGAGTESTGTGGTGTENTGTEISSDTNLNKPNITLLKQNQVNSPKIITENTKVIQDLNSLGVNTTNLIPNLNNAILNLINSPIGTQGIINEDGTFSITRTGTEGAGTEGAGTGTGTEGTGTGTGTGGIGTDTGGTDTGTGGTGIGTGDTDTDNETNIIISTKPNKDKTLIEKISINQNLEGTGIDITISNLSLQIEDKYYKALEDSIDKDPEDPNNAKLWEKITEEEALEIYFNSLELTETPSNILSGGAGTGTGTEGAGTGTGTGGAGTGTGTEGAGIDENTGEVTTDLNKTLEDSLKPGANPPFKYKDFIFILENNKENKLSIPRRRIVATRETDGARIEGDYSFSATTQILVDETKFLVDRFLNSELNLIYNKVDIRLKETKDLIS
jgi:chaperonin cofactor prefoldin